MRKILFLFAVMSCMAFFSCHHSEKEDEESVEFIATKPLLRDTHYTKEYVCQIKAIQHIELRAFEKGYLQKIYVDEGQFIKQGQRMFQIMPNLISAEYQKALAEANFAEVEYQNTKSLADNNVVSPSELALAKAKLDKAKAELAYIKTHLDFTEIKAPFDGIMDHFNVRLGSYLNEGDLLTTLSDNSQMWVYFYVPEAEYLNYMSQPKNDSTVHVHLRMANNQMYAYQGKIQTIEADFNNETGNIDFRAIFPNPDRLLRHGETGNILMTLPYKNALLIPQKATFEVLEKKYVFVVGNDNKVEQREIQIAAELPDIYVIKSGISVKDKIIVEGISKIKNGDEIKFRIEKPEDVLRNLQVYVE